MIEIFNNALLQIVLLSIPFLAVGLVVSLGVGVFQAVTQIQDATIAFILKLVILSILLIAGLPWFLQMMTDYSHNLYVNIGITSDAP